LPHPPAASIVRALSSTGRDADPWRAERVARKIAAYGAIDLAVAALAHDEASDLLSDLLAYRAALAELADPALHAARLRRQARDLDARAEPAWAESAEFFGKARHRDLQGECDLAATFLRRAEAAERLAAAMEADAFALRLEAAALEGADLRRQAWREVMAA
jgi:hypothetical protein